MAAEYLGERQGLVVTVKGGLVSRYKVGEVFTPATQALVNFIDRNTVNDQLVDALRTPGKQLIVYGESGSGKSTLLLNKLRQTYSAHVTTQCSSSTTYEQLLLNAFDQLDEYYVEGRSSQRGRTISPTISADFLRIKAAIEANMSKVAGQSESRIVPPQLTPQRLAQFLGEQEMCWVVEDFHKMAPSEKLPFAQSMKIFSDVSAIYPEVKTITIGAMDTARQVVEYDREMTNRVSEILVPLMTDDELTEILLNGERLLNISLAELIEPIVEYSVGVPSVCHQLALNACLERQVEVTQISRRALTSDDLVLAVERYTRESSDSLKARFDKALVRHRVRRFDNPRLILSALASGPLSGMRVPEILVTIRTAESDYPVGNLTRYLKELTEDERGSVIKLGADGKYRFAEPLYHTFAQATLLVKTLTRYRSASVASIAADKLAGWFYSDGVLSTSFDVTPGSEFDYWSKNFLTGSTTLTYYGTAASGAEPSKPQLVASPERRRRKEAPAATEKDD